MDLTWSPRLQVYLLPWNSPHKTWSHNWILISIVWNECMSLSTRLPVSWWRNFYPLHFWCTMVSPSDCLFLSWVLSWAGFIIATFHSAFKVAGMSKEKGTILRCKQECAGWRKLAQVKQSWQRHPHPPVTSRNTDCCSYHVEEPRILLKIWNYHGQGPVGAWAVGIRHCKISLLSLLQVRRT